MSKQSLSQNRENVKSVQSIYQGPIPTPEMLKAYNEIDSTLVNRIILMAEKNNDANIEINKRTLSINETLVKENSKLQNRGQWFILLIVLMSFMFAIASAFILKNTAISVVSLLVSAIGVGTTVINKLLK